MPLAINDLQASSLGEKIREFAQSIPKDTGYTIEELCEKFGGSYSGMSAALRQSGCSIKRRVDSKEMRLLVHPETASNYADPIA